MELATKTSMT